MLLTSSLPWQLGVQPLQEENSVGGDWGVEVVREVRVEGKGGKGSHSGMRKFGQLFGKP